MTTRPKARRFRLRLGDDQSEALRTSVAPQRAARAARPEGEGASATRPTQPATAADAAARPPAQEPPRTPPQPAAQDPAQAANGDALFDENADEAPPSYEPRPKAQTEHIRRPKRPQSESVTEPGANAADGNAASTEAAGDQSSPTAQEHGADVTGSASVDAEIDAIRNEGLTGRQLRMAMRVAQRNGIRATSGMDAVRLLRKQGIDPFARATLLDIVKQEGAKSRELTTTEPADAAPKLPKAYRQAQPPAPVEPTTDAAQRQAEVSKIQRDIARRRRRRMTLLMARLFVFVGIPTLIAGWYFYAVATPLYATESEFVIQQADGQAAPSIGGLAGMMGGGAGGNDSISVQGFLQSREAMQRLDADHGFISYFQREEIDPLRRLEANATAEAAYRLYQDMVLVSYDPMEGIIRMEVIAADPTSSERFARALVQYAEERVDQLTQRLRENQMSDAVESVNLAEQRMVEAQQRVLDLQENYEVLSGEVEVNLLTQQITTLEGQLNQERLDLSDLQANPRPNPARLEQANRRISALETQITELRSRLTQGANGGTSLARVQRELAMAETDVQTRLLILQGAMQQQEAARMEASRQVRYLSLGVSPVASDEPAYPRAFENTSLAFLIFAGIYLMISMTSAILREQVTG